MRISDWSSDVCSSDLTCSSEWRCARHERMLAVAHRVSPHKDVYQMKLSAIRSPLPSVTRTLHCTVCFASSVITGLITIGPDSRSNPLSATLTLAHTAYVSSEDGRGGQGCVSRCRTRWGTDK